MTQTTDLTAEDRSKDAFFTRIAEVSQEMIGAHGKDFAMGTLVLAARWIADNKISAAKPPH
ncbi:hypothetical protein KM031_18800 (plasmid) [Gemmobacter fulvus]|uniref:Uncharacterized protein n=1 Tax=Gemmobacter fulvus TaxID=2840474 RepID=A0A975PBQ2_9RHOB|nr:hypothetical protein [Gemmobacter fulvus]MBT9246611.1 hypothetical protein [Gemmobacter fulvus]MDQ1849581.1 hypothetical protein [Gemmobacter fulvus]QWK92698.1 hypothetical protein KM031_18800 [Gemmobacter fulvus]